jgi:tetratricopeptide (TPR) repeat protein
MFRDVRYRGLAGWLGEKSEMISTRKFSGRASRNALRAVLFCAVAALPVRAGENLTLPPEAGQAMNTMYAGDFEGAITILHAFEQAQPENPLGYLLEDEAQWWKIYCANSQVKYGMVDAWKRGKRPEDESYIELTDKIIRLAQEQIATSDTAEMHLYAGLGWALRARIDALRGENHAVAHAGVTARAEFLRALELDPQMADATGGLGLYNYYVDSLPGVVKFLRFFMGIPGGNKKEGIQQMQTAIEHGVLMPVEMRFYLAKNLRTYDQQFEQAIAVARPLVERYPKNPLFQLFLGNLNAEMGRDDKAAEYFRATIKLAAPDSACGNCAGCAGCTSCAAHARELANSFLPDGSPN